MKPRRSLGYGYVLRRQPGKPQRIREMRLASWNVRTLYEAGALRKLTTQLKEHNVDIAAIQEMRWIGNGILEKKGEIVFYSCDEKRHVFGVGFVVQDAIRNTILNFKPVSPRICILRIKGTFFNFSLINVHAPTEEKEEAEKDCFYLQLEKEYDLCPKNDIKIVLGDLNAKVGKDSFFEPNVGREGMHMETNNNGARLVSFATSKNMMIGGTRFTHKNIHKGTWRTPDNKNVNQIDHILIDLRHMSNLMDVRVHRRANMDSDHFLLISKIRSRISNVRKGQGDRVIRYNIDNLKQDQIANVYSKKMKELIHGKETTGNSLDEAWETIKNCINRAAENTLGKSCVIQRGGWFDQECEEKTAAKNIAYRSALQRKTRAAEEEYKKLRREEKRVHQKKKREFTKKQIDDLEQHREMNNVRLFYKNVNEQRRSFKPRQTMCRNKNGNIITERSKVLERWREYINETMNGGDESMENTEIDPQQYQNQNQIEEDEVEPPTYQNFEDALKKMKNNKAPGKDGINIELIKAGGKEIHQHLYELIKRSWTEETIPHEWKVSALCPIHKKGNVLNCENYRGISLLNTSYKILSNILFQKLKPYVEKEVGEYQAGFRTGRSTVDQMFSLRQILEKTHEYKIETHHLFVDFKAAYDSVKRNKMYTAMEELGIPPKLIRLIKMTMKDSIIQVKVQSAYSDPLIIKNGVRQGDALACLLFNIVLERAVRKSGIQTSGHIFNKSVQLLGYADDIDIIARSKTALCEAFTALEIAAKEMGLEVNERKTKYICVGGKKETSTKQWLTIGTYNFEQVDGFSYLGTWINSQNNIGEEIKKRISTANRSYYGLQKHLKSRILSKKTKVQLYKTLIKPVVLYGAESWTLSQIDEHQLDIFERKILRKILGPVKENGLWRARYNIELYKLYEEPRLSWSMRIARLRWAGHVKRMDGDRMPRALLEGRPGGTRRRGRPRSRWIDEINEDARRIGVRKWWNVALDRDEWDRRIREARTLV